MYLPDTAVLLTRFLADEGVAEISDFMPVEEARQAGPQPGAARQDGPRGDSLPHGLRPALRLRPRAARGASARGGEALFLSQGFGGAALRLHSDVPVEIRDGAAIAEFTLQADESAAFILEWTLPGQPAVALNADYVSRAFTETVDFWRQWVGALDLRGPLARNGQPVGR